MALFRTLRTAARFRGNRLMSKRFDSARFDPNKLAEDVTPAWKQALKFREKQLYGSKDGDNKDKNEDADREDWVKYNEELLGKKDLEKEMYHTFGTRMDLIDKQIPLAPESQFPFKHLPTALLTLDDDKYINLSTESRCGFIVCNFSVLTRRCSCLVFVVCLRALLRVCGCC